MIQLSSAKELCESWLGVVYHAKPLYVMTPSRYSILVF